MRSPVSAGLGTSCASDAAAQFFAPSAKGCILPDTKVAMRFAFQPSKPGIFTEEWHLRLTPAPKVPVKPVLMRGVCLEAPERQHQVRTLQAELARRRTWFAVQDILERDVLDSVFRTTIPDGVRVDAVLTPSTAPRLRRLMRRRTRQRRRRRRRPRASASSSAATPRRRACHPPSPRKP